MPSPTLSPQAHDSPIFAQAQKRADAGTLQLLIKQPLLAGGSFATPST